MTTIAYHADFGVAGDTQLTQRRVRIGETEKIGRSKARGFLWGAAGRLGFITSMAAWARAQTKRGDASLRAWLETLPTPGGSDEALIVNPDHRDCVLVFDRYGLEPVSAEYYAIGSGASFALGAMALGNCPRDAVLAASKHCTLTSPKVTSLDW